MSANRKLLIMCVGIPLMLWPSEALAHPMKGVGDFYAGMLHPITALEAVLPMIALSLFAGQQKREAAIKLLIAFPAALIFGALLAASGHVPSYIGIIQLAFAATFGVLVAIARPLPVWLLLVLAIELGVAIGWSNAAELTSEVSPYRFVAGLALVGLLLIIYGIGLVRQLKAPWSQIAVRVAGSWIGAVGILVLGLK